MTDLAADPLQLSTDGPDRVLTISTLYHFSFLHAPFSFRHHINRRNLINRPTWPINLAALSRSHLIPHLTPFEFRAWTNARVLKSVFQNLPSGERGRQSPSRLARGLPFTGLHRSVCQPAPEIPFLFYLRRSSNP